MATSEKEISKQINEKIARIIDELTDKNLAEKYALYDNQLKEEADNGNDEFTYEFLLRLTSVLSSFIIQNYMSERGYSESAEDEWGRWEKT